MPQLPVCSMCGQVIPKGEPTRTLPSGKVVHEACFRGE